MYLIGQITSTTSTLPLLDHASKISSFLLKNKKIIPAFYTRQVFLVPSLQAQLLTKGSNADLDFYVLQLILLFVLCKTTN
jgi:hypothetical protein